MSKTSDTSETSETSNINDENTMPIVEPKNDELTDALLKSEEYLQGWKRSQADYQNLQKECAQKQLEYVKYANGELIQELLPIMDNFKAAFRQIPETEKDSAWVVGFSYIKKQFEDMLRQNGVEPIKTEGEPFNPMEHDAVESVKDETVESGMIIAERKAGYKLNGKVIQAAKVVVNQ
jgi:molecular chaperone GrpE